MGIPKFFRWMSERYHGLLVTARENQLPEVDNFYLDMNGIIHNCSHPCDGDVHFRISEEEMFEDIFNYINTLFEIIKPKKYFFMAVDGVAPRAKMNHQRGRRFRSVKEALDRETAAVSKGDILPTEERFDSNCITPGTGFMVRLNQALEEFTCRKLSTDPSWRQVKVILSGHAAPGEGEHKIMDFIRFQRSQPDYKPETRHCIYGLDTDLIMLGLSSHEPNFVLLREEVKFNGKLSDSTKSKSKRVDPTKIKFNVLYLDLLRNYIEKDYSHLKQKLSYPFNLEAIIDDWILICFLIGNDFIPHLPHFHIHKGVLPRVFDIYQSTLIKLDGYMNENGILNMKRFKIFAKALTIVDFANFKSFVRECGNERLCNRLELNDFIEYKRNYYSDKFHIDPSKDNILDIVKEYVRALQWNLHYYYQGCVSWGWYYPHHYAPFISDVANFINVDTNFVLGQPYKPFEQLLSVLPAQSAILLPKVYRHLVLREDSPLAKYFPKKVEFDLNGKQNDWEAVILAPFINQDELQKASVLCDLFLSEEERKVNKHGPHLMFTYDKSQRAKDVEKNQLKPIDFVKRIEIGIDEFRLPRERIKFGLLYTNGNRSQSMHHQGYRNNSSGNNSNNRNSSHGNNRNTSYGNNRNASYGNNRNPRGQKYTLNQNNNNSDSNSRHSNKYGSTRNRYSGIN